MGKMKEIAIDVDEIMEKINDRLNNEDTAYGLIFTGALISKLKEKQARIAAKWLEEGNHD